MAKIPTTGDEFSSKGQKILFLGDIVHALRVQLQHPEVAAIFDVDQTAATATISNATRCASDQSLIFNFLCIRICGW